jgi:hypothetical protein
LPFLYYKFILTPRQLGFSWGLIALVPFFLGGVGYAVTALGCFLFNALAARFGGLEIELVDLT